MKSIDQLKKTENETLRTFDEEIPSLQFSHEDDSKFENYLKNYKNFYINNLKFPPEMFRNKSMIDFGAGAGSNTLWNAFLMVRLRFAVRTLHTGNLQNHWKT